MERLSNIHRAAIAAVLGVCGLAACVGTTRALTGTQTQSVAAGVAARWVEVWRDDFDGRALDRSKWIPEESCWGGGNNERQCYTDRDENIRVDGGVLRLIAQREAFTGPLYPEGMDGAPGGTKTQSYTSGKIRTHTLASWQYGRISARMKLPGGRGTWPAFWMMPEHSVYGGWPLSGEIDIMEAVNLGVPCETCAAPVETRTSGAIHFGSAWPDNTYLMHHAPEAPHNTPSENWRVYSVEWAEGVIQWLVDGYVFMRIEHDAWHSASPLAQGRDAAPFDQPFYAMINLAVGGNLAEQSNGGGFDAAAFPAEVLVDWVSVEQCDGSPSGRDCLVDQAWRGSPKGPHHQPPQHQEGVG